MGIHVHTRWHRDAVHMMQRCMSHMDGRLAITNTIELEKGDRMKSDSREIPQKNFVLHII